MSWIDTLPEDERSKLQQTPHPEWISPMLATLTRDHFSHPSWIYERKLDGQRLLAFRSGTDLRLMSRNRKPNSFRYPEIRDALGDLDINDFILDGEVVAFDGNVSSFARLQPRMQIDDETTARASQVDVSYYVFDMLRLDGFDMTQLPLRRRKTVLRDAFSFGDPIRFTPHRNEDGEAYFEDACRKGWEGLIAKDASAAYTHGRSRHWLKFKCSNEQEFVVGGYTNPHGSRVGFGALLLGVFEGYRLRYAGKVGTGFDEDTLRRLHAKLSSLERKTSPYAGEGIPSRGVHWVTPRLVVQVGFTAWTRDGRLRHPRYIGRRDDKEPTSVTRELPAAVAA